MAVYLKYRQISEDETSADYEIHTEPNEPDRVARRGRVDRYHTRIIGFVATSARDALRHRERSHRAESV